MEWFRWSKKREAPPTATRIYLHDDYIQQHLIGMDFSALVALPNSVERNEWLAMHIVSFTENVGLIYAALSEFCQSTTCPQMLIPGGTLQWVDDKNKKRACSAPQYIDLVMSLAQRNVDDESTLPTKHGHLFPSDLETTLRRLVRLYFHVVAHMYQAHYEAAIQVGLVPYLNTVAYHLMSFAKAFHLVDDRDLQPLADLHDQLHSSAIAAQARRIANQRPMFVNGALMPWMEYGPLSDNGDNDKGNY